MPNQPAATKAPFMCRLDRDLLTAAKAQAEKRGETMTAVIERALSEYLTPPPAPAR